MKHNTRFTNQVSSEVTLKLTSIIGFLLLMSFSLSVNAQYDFREGSIVLNSNDTISGLIDYSTPQINAQFCNFQLKKEGEITKYSPTELSAYFFKDSKVYASKSVTIDNVEGRYFLEYLIDGIVDIYYLKNGQFPYYFIENVDGLYELNIENRTIRKDGASYEIVDERYKKVLAALMQGSKEISKDIENTKLNHISLIKLTEKYHNSVCEDEKCIIYSKPEMQLNDANWRLRFGVSVGYVASNSTVASQITWRKRYWYYENRLEFVNIIDSNLASSNDGTKVVQASNNVIMPGFFLNLSRNRRYSIQLEAHYLSQNISLEDYEMKFSSLIVPFVCKYEFNPYKKIRPFGNVGLAMSFNEISITDGEIFLDYEYPIDDDGSVLFLPAQSYISFYDDFENVQRELSLLLGVGLIFYPNKRNTIELELRRWRAENNFNAFFDDVAKSSTNISLENWALLGKVSF